VGRWILGTTSGAAVIPDTYRLQAGDADDTTSFDNHTMFHEASLERPPGSGNALFGEGTTFHSREVRSLRCGWLVPAQAASERESWEVTVTASLSIPIAMILVRMGIGILSLYLCGSFAGGASHYVVFFYRVGLFLYSVVRILTLPQKARELPLN
jgi:hypothetical protein